MTYNIKTEARGWASLRFGILSYCLGAAGEVFEEFCHVDAVCKGMMHRQIEAKLTHGTLEMKNRRSGSSPSSIVGQVFARSTSAAA